MQYVTGTGMTTLGEIAQVWAYFTEQKQLMKKKTVPSFGNHTREFKKKKKKHCLSSHASYLNEAY